MNDRCVNLLENYEIDVLRTWKGRGAILCETNIGTLVLKEYKGNPEKCAFQEEVLSFMKDHGFTHTETYLRNKENELLTIDSDGSSYLLKTHVEGRECDVKDLQECCLVMETLGRMHRACPGGEEISFAGNIISAEQEFEKHNKELRRVRKFLKDKGQKNDFEIYLMSCFDYFLDFALQIAEEYAAFGNKEQGGGACAVSHGDFQHHNIILSGKEFYIINFEKCSKGSPVRDIYLFMRKLLEKSNWKPETGFFLLTAYEKENRLSEEDYVNLYYRLSYPEKFWKIVNYYYNAPKAWIPGKHLEKLMKVTGQEPEKIEFLSLFREKYGIMSV